MAVIAGLAVVGALLTVVGGIVVDRGDTVADRGDAPFTSATTAPAPTPTESQGRRPYSLNTAGLDRDPVQVEDGGHVDQPFTAKTTPLDLLTVIIGRNDPDQGFEDDAPIGRVRFQILDEGRILHDQRTEARNNTATGIEVNLAVQPGEEYVLRVINEERDTQLGFYFTKERKAYAVVQDGPGEAPYEYPHQLSATVRGYD